MRNTRFKIFIVIGLISIASTAHAGFFNNLFSGKPLFGAASPTVLTVPQGGTGNTTFTVGECLVGNDKNPVTTVPCSAGTTVTSVSAGNTSLTISPTTGAVSAVLNVGNANTWTAQQTINGAALLVNNSTSTITNLTMVNSTSTNATTTYLSVGTLLSGATGIFTGAVTAAGVQSNGTISFTTLGTGNNNAVLCRNSSGRLSNCVLPAFSVLVGDDTGTLTSSSTLTIELLHATSTATSTFEGGVQVRKTIDVQSTSASSTFGNGIQITNGCFSQNGTCITSGTGSGSTFGQAWELFGGGTYLSPTTTNIGIVVNAATSSIAKLSLVGATTTTLYASSSIVANGASSTIANLNMINATTSNVLSVGTLATTSQLVVDKGATTTALYVGKSGLVVNAASSTITNLTVANFTVGSTLALPAGSVTNTMLQNSTISGVALGGTLANLTAGDTSLTFSGTYTGASAQTIVLNVGNANTWTAAQTINGAALLVNNSTSTITNLDMINSTSTFATTSYLSVGTFASTTKLRVDGLVQPTFVVSSSTLPTTSGAPGTGHGNAVFSCEACGTGNNNLLSIVDYRGAPGILTFQAAGSPANPSATINGQNILLLGSRGYGTGWDTAPNTSITFDAAQTFTGSAHGTRITFSTTLIGSLGRIERVRIEDSGKLDVATTTGSQTFNVHGSALFSGDIVSVANITATGTLSVAGLSTLSGGVLVNNSTSTISNLDIVNSTSTNATSTYLNVSTFASTSSLFVNKVITHGASSTPPTLTTFAYGSIDNFLDSATTVIRDGTPYSWTMATDTTATLPIINVSTIGNRPQFCIASNCTTIGSLQSALEVRGVGTTSLIVSRFLNGLSQQILLIQSNQHVTFAQGNSAYAPTISSCGTGANFPGAGDNDHVARFQIGSTAGQATCTITFHLSFSRTPTCAANDETDGTALYVVPDSVTNTNYVVNTTAGGGFENDIIDTFCLSKL